jgi:hypothetical protein
MPSLKGRMSGELRRATEEELSLLKNGQRFLMAVPYKNLWEIERDKTQTELRATEDRLKKLQTEHDKLQTRAKDLAHAHELLTAELAKAKCDLDYAWNQLVRGKLSSRIEDQAGPRRHNADRHHTQRCLCDRGAGEDSRQQAGPGRRISLFA